MPGSAAFLAPPADAADPLAYQLSPATHRLPRLPTLPAPGHPGEWWLEYYRYYSASDVRRMATAMGRALALPQDFNTRRELLRDTDRRHCR